MLDFFWGRLVWFFLALTFAISLSFPSGYNIGSSLVFISTVSILFFKNNEIIISWQDKRIILVFLSYAIYAFFSVYLDGWHVRELDRPSRFILAIPVLILILKVKGNINWLWYGVIFGAMSASFLAIYEKIFLGISRAHGSENPIMFGNISMLMGMMSFTGFFYFFKRRNYLWGGVALFGGIGGIIASILSGTRGGWVALPLICFFILWNGRDLIGKKKIIITFFITLGLIATAISIPQTGIQNRILSAANNISHYVSGENKNTSVGLRFEMWKASVEMFKNSPFFGVGEYASYDFKRELAEQGMIIPEAIRFSHAHNEYLNALGLTGIFGFIMLMTLYLLPLKLFLNKMKAYENNWDIRSYAMAGALIPMCYMDFALTQSMFSHNIGVMMYAFPIIYFWAAVRWAEREEFEKATVD
ncbi:O-antigen ligase family protein [Marinomonas sp. TW1]|uniref:O-antigen ligase family protein n=1 Tax=Marinomonas sp. TW1 TaxID=1561203 RepID=UPI0007AF1939|nr:O-antigen ligase family protein [Marinomonas sp. TW1]KZN15061.1 polymerase [Marinomonas sp. TW1]